MSADWPVVNLSELVDELTVGFVGSMTKEYVNEGIPFLRSKNIVPYNVNWDDIRYISENFHKKLSKSILHPGDVAIVRTGKPGTACVIPESITEANCSDVVIARVNDEKLNAHYLAFFMNSIATHQVNSHLVGAVQQHFNVGSAKQLKIPLPSRKEQENIVTILKNLNDKIKLNHQINQTLEEMTQAIFKSWFVDFEPVKAKIEAKANNQDPERAAMCVISGKNDTGLDQLSSDQLTQLRNTAALFPDEFIDSELGLIPRGWEVMTLGNCKLEIESGKRPKGGIDKSLGHGVPSVGAESVSPIGNFDYSKVKYVTEDFALTAKKGWVQNLDVALYKDGGKPGQFKPRVSLYGNSFPFERFMINEHVFLLRSELLGSYFLFYTISSTRALDQLIAKASAKAAQPGLNQGEVKGTHFLYPGQDIVKCFNRLMSSNVSMRHTNGLENQTLSNLRDTLLPKLLSGEIELGQGA